MNDFYVYQLMELTTAISLIEKGIDKNATSQTWADLGAGKGLFTKALASLLDEKSSVYAIDKDAQSLKLITNKLTEVAIEKVKSDFSYEEIKGGPFDGILMANSLHYIQDQSEFLIRLSKQLKPGGKIILIEYDMDTSNAWVPYPVSYHKLVKLANTSGFAVDRLGETPSVYKRADIYSVVLKQIAN